MAFTAQDVANLKSALATGATSVRVGDKLVEYRSLADIRAILQQAEAEISGASPRRVRFVDYDGGRL